MKVVLMTGLRTFLFCIGMQLMIAGPQDGTHIKAATDALQEGVHKLQEKQIDAAIGAFRVALQIEPTYTEAFSRLFEAFSASGNKVDAAATLTRLLEIEPDRPSERIKLGQLLLEQGQPQRALAQFAYALNLQSQDADALYGFAKAAKQTGMTDRALEAWKTGKHSYPDDVRFKGEHP